MTEEEKQRKKTGYKNQWQAENLERIIFQVPKGKKQVIKAAADAAGVSLNRYVTDAVDARLEAELPEQESDTP